MFFSGLLQMNFHDLQKSDFKNERRLIKLVKIRRRKSVKEGGEEYVFFPQG
jgi:hypothetical protein